HGTHQCARSAARLASLSGGWQWWRSDRDLELPAGVAVTAHFDSCKDTPLERVEAYLQGLRLTSARIDELRAAVAASKPETHRDAIACLYETLASDATGDGEAGLVAR